ncbi:MAG: cyclic nucleotide-binding domain-containing protein [Deltaproteobacteria bacterium]|nr:MAG: cyclic nucleotide-binding domain-containing protein [Deltaproteobacteria bacterium]
MAPRLKLFGWQATDVGRRRNHNEDAVLVDPEVGLYVVADGVGGYSAGDVASRMVVEGMQSHLRSRPDLFGRQAIAPGQPLSDEHRRQAKDYLDQAVQAITYQIFSQSRQRGNDFRMGSTLCAMVVLGDVACIVHVGDSRCYLYRDGTTYQLTEDHSLIAEQLKMGLISQEEAATSRYKNVITRAVGMADRLQVDLFFVDLLPHDAFLVCSDGFHGYLAKGELATMLSQHDLSKVPQQAVDLANQRGGKDNITVVVVSVEGREASRTTEIVASVDVLRHSPLFQDMSYPESLKVLSASSQKVFEPGEVVLREGDPSRELYIVQSGELGIFRGQEMLAVLGVGDYVGEMGLYDGAPVSATVVSQERTECLVINGEEFLKMMRQSPDIGFKIQHNLVLVLLKRLRDTSHALAWTRQEWRRNSPNSSQ